MSKLNNREVIWCALPESLFVLGVGTIQQPLYPRGVGSKVTKMVLDADAGILLASFADKGIKAEVGIPVSSVKHMVFGAPTEG